jgi:hypothetical protein
MYFESLQIYIYKNNKFIKFLKDNTLFYYIKIGFVNMKKNKILCVFYKKIILFSKNLL